MAPDYLFKNCAKIKSTSIQYQLSQYIAYNIYRKIYRPISTKNSKLIRLNIYLTPVLEINHLGLHSNKICLDCIITRGSGVLASWTHRSSLTWPGVGRESGGKYTKTTPFKPYLALILFLSIEPRLADKLKATVDWSTIQYRTELPPQL